MKPLALDFLAVRAPSRWGGILLVLGLALCTGAGAAFWQMQQQRQSLELSVAELSAQRSVRGARPVASKVDDKTRALGVVSERISVPWERLFQDVESCDGPDVALLQLQPNITQRQVMLMGEARDRLSLEAYMKRLDQTASLEGVHLAQHNQAPDSGPWAVRFAITARWLYSSP